MDNSYYEKEKEALEWWSKLPFSAQINITQDWQKQLAVDFMKTWPFISISKSNSARHRIYEWHLLMKKKAGIDPDILTDKKY